jgi:hypothetical protein
MSGVTVTVGRRMCPTCAGSRMVNHPLWEQFWRDYHNLPAEDRDGRIGKMTRAWFREHDHPAPPPEEIVCPECAGNGHTGTERPLDDVVQNLYDLIERQDSRIQALEEQLTGN